MNANADDDDSNVMKSPSLSEDDAIPAEKSSAKKKKSSKTVKNNDDAGDDETNKTSKDSSIIGSLRENDTLHDLDVDIFKDLSTEQSSPKDKRKNSKAKNKTTTQKYKDVEDEVEVTSRGKQSKTSTKKKFRTSSSSSTTTDDSGENTANFERKSSTKTTESSKSKYGSSTTRTTTSRRGDEDDDDEKTTSSSKVTRKIKDKKNEDFEEGFRESSSTTAKITPTKRPKGKSKIRRDEEPENNEEDDLTTEKLKTSTRKLKLNLNADLNKGNSSEEGDDDDSDLYPSKPARAMFSSSLVTVENAAESTKNTVLDNLEDELEITTLDSSEKYAEGEVEESTPYISNSLTTNLHAKLKKNRRKKDRVTLSSTDRYKSMTIDELLESEPIGGDLFEQTLQDDPAMTTNVTNSPRDVAAEDEVEREMGLPDAPSKSNGASNKSSSSPGRRKYKTLSSLISAAFEHEPGMTSTSAVVRKRRRPKLRLRRVHLFSTGMLEKSSRENSGGDDANSTDTDLSNGIYY